MLEGYPYFNPSVGKMAGGAELQLFYLSTELAKKSNYNVSFIVGNYKQPETGLVKNVRLLRSFNADRNDGVFKKINQAIRFFRILKREKPDIILSSTNNTLVTLCSLYSIFVKSKHIHRIAHNKDTGFERRKEFGFLARLYCWGMKRANKILVQNLEQQDQLLKNFNKQSILLKNAFPVTKQTELSDDYVLWVSRYQTWKQPELFIKLAQEVQDRAFLMICPPPQGKEIENWKELKQKAEQLTNLQFIDYVPFSQIQIYFNKASIFINTSQAEGFPNTFLQAAQGKVAIVSLNVNPNSFITKYNCGVFCNNDFTYLVEHVKLLLNDKKNLTEKAENNYNYLEQNHTITSIGNQLEKIIKELV